MYSRSIERTKSSSAYCVPSNSAFRVKSVCPTFSSADIARGYQQQCLTLCLSQPGNLCQRRPGQCLDNTHSICSTCSPSTATPLPQNDCDSMISVVFPCAVASPSPFMAMVMRRISLVVYDNLSRCHLRYLFMTPTPSTRTMILHFSLVLVVMLASPAADADRRNFSCPHEDSTPKNLRRYSI